MYAELANIILELQESENYYATFNVENRVLEDIAVGVEGPSNLSIFPKNVTLKFRESCDFLVHAEPEAVPELENATISVICTGTESETVVSLTEYSVKIVKGGRQQFTRRPTPDTPLNPIFGADCFKCTICLMDYNHKEYTPRSLYCGHTVCTACVKTLWKAKHIDCPFDRQSTPAESVEAVSKNFLVLEILKMKYPNSREDHALEIYTKAIELEKTLKTTYHWRKFQAACFTPEHPLVKEFVEKIVKSPLRGKKREALRSFHNFVRSSLKIFEANRGKLEKELEVIKNGLDQVEAYFGMEDRTQHLDKIIEIIEPLLKWRRSAEDRSPNTDPVLDMKGFVDFTLKYEDEDSGSDDEASLQGPIRSSSFTFSWKF